MAIWKMIRAFAGTEGGLVCRVCGESIARSDGFGTSEGVCGPCRAPEAYNGIRSLVSAR